MNYEIQPLAPLTHLLAITMEVSTKTQTTIELKLPRWRPGRYEAANYAKNIKKISFKDEHDKKLKFTKTDHSTWKIQTNSEKVIAVYEYYAHQLDAGNSWYSEDQVYINFINCLLYSENHVNDACEIKLTLPPNYSIACGLSLSGNNILNASSYYEVVDSPLIASHNIKKLAYSSHGIPFSIWFQGQHNLDTQRVINDFKKFTDYQIETLGEFPEKEYHFMNEITSYKHYHGVEHSNSTVICIGPGTELNQESLYSELLGVSSHELFHAWNIIKIRPIEMMPYDFSRPPFFPTGYVAEGFTTYYGDVFLVRSAVFSVEWYFNELSKLLTRHFHNYGRLTNSVIDSSLDLWLDGYQASVPNKKASIYVEGAMIALTLDLLIRKNTLDTNSLDNVMRELWHKFGKCGKGYSLEDIQGICETVNDSELSDYFDDYVYGVKDKAELIENLFNHVGCTLSIKENDSVLEGKIGIKVLPVNGNFVITSIAPDSEGEKCFSVNDRIIKVNGVKISLDVIKRLKSSDLTLEIERAHEIKTITVTLGRSRYFTNYAIKKIKNPSAKQKDSFNSWMNNSY